MKVAAAVVVLLAIAIGVVPMFTDCHSAGRALTLADGREIPMKCHWTGRAELGLSLPLLAVGLMLGFSRRKEVRRMLGLAGTTLGAVVLLLPTELIGVCMNPDMPCVSTMKPALLLTGALVIGVSVVVVAVSWGAQRDRVNLRRLVLRNILGSLFRSGAIFLCAALVAGLSLSATLVVRGAETGLRRNLSRMGADIVVIPWGTMSQDFDGAHMVGLMSDRWMPRVYMDRIAAVQGVEAVTPQLYLSTLTDSPFCRLPEMYLVAYDAATDFVLKPWLDHDPIGMLRLGEAVGGVAVFDPDGDQYIQVYGYPLRLVRTLQETGGDVDHALFVSFDTAQAILEHVESQPNPPFEIAPESISSAMVKVRLGSNPHDVAVRILEQVPGMVPLESTGFFQTQRAQMVGLLRTVLALATLTWLLAMLFVGLVFSLAANERRREIATLRALGATSAVVLKTLLLEGVTLALIGGALGISLVVLAAGLFSEPIARATGIQMVLPSPLLLTALVAAGLLLAMVSVAVAAWLPASRISRQEPALTMRE